MGIWLKSVYFNANNQLIGKVKEIVRVFALIKTLEDNKAAISSKIQLYDETLEEAWKMVDLAQDHEICHNNLEKIKRKLIH